MFRKLIFTLLMMVFLFPSLNAQTSFDKVETFQINEVNTRGLSSKNNGTSEEFDYGEFTAFGCFMLMAGEKYPHQSLQYKVQTWYNPNDEIWKKTGVEPNYETWKRAITSLVYSDWQNPEDGTWHHTYLTAEDFRFMRDSLPELIEVRMGGSIEIRAYEGENGTLNGYHTYPAGEIPPYAFDKTYNIKKLNKKRQYRVVLLPKNTTSIGEYALANIIDLYLEDEKFFNDNFSTVSRFWDDNYDGYINLKNLKGLKTIKEGAFHNTISTRVYLPENLEYIGKNAFNSDIIKDRPINTNLDSIVVTSATPPIIEENSFGEKFKMAKIVAPSKKYYLNYKYDKQWGLSNKLTYFGYVSPNPIDIRLDKEMLIINIKTDATETGVVSCFQEGKKVSDIELTTGNNTVHLNPKMEYKISVEEEEFNLKPYKVNTK